MYQFYSPPARSSFRSIVLMTVLLAVLMHLVGFVYACMFFFAPVSQVSLLLLLFGAMAASYVSNLFIQSVRITSRKERIRFASFAGFVLWYSSWTCLFHLVEAETPSLLTFYSQAGYWLNPLHFIEGIQTMIEFKSQGFDLYFNIPFTLFLWVVELGIFIVLPWLHAKTRKERPYSETQKKWYKRFTLDTHFQHITNPNALLPKLEKSGPKVLDKLMSGRPQKYASLTIFYLPGQSTYYFALINKDPNEEDFFKSSLVHPPVAISGAEVNDLLQKYPGKKEAWMEAIA